MSMSLQLTISAKAFCEENGIHIGHTRLRRIVQKTIRRMEHERERLEEIKITTPDGHSFIDYRDPTGESAVRNIMRELLNSPANASKVA